MRRVVTSTLTSAWSAWRLLARVKGRQVLMYHAIGSTVPDDRQGRYSIPPERFEAQVAWLAGSGVQVCPFAEDTGRAGVSITFDDGYRDNLETAHPILQRHGLPHTIFVVTDFARSGDKLYLDAADLKTLAASPLVKIGSHGKSHRRLADLDAPNLREELRGSKSWLEDLLGRPIDAMSYPHGSVNARVRDAVADAGYSWAACSEFGANPRGRDSLLQRRLDIWNTDGLDDFRAKLEGHWDWMGMFTKVRV